MLLLFQGGQTGTRPDGVTEQDRGRAEAQFPRARPQAGPGLRLGAPAAAAPMLGCEGGRPGLQQLLAQTQPVLRLSGEGAREQGPETPRGRLLGTETFCPKSRKNLDSFACLGPKCN